MKRRKNAVYTGKSTRSGTGTGDRKIVNLFYKQLNEVLRPEDEIEIIPPEQVNPTHAVPKQVFIVVDYCIRKILPEVTSLFRWGDEVTPRLRALAPIVDRKTVKAAEDATSGVEGAVRAVARAATSDAARRAAARAVDAARAATADAAYDVYAAAVATGAAIYAANTIYFALITCIEADHEAAYNRIIDLTNEMLESL